MAALLVDAGLFVVPTGFRFWFLRSHPAMIQVLCKQKSLSGKARVSLWLTCARGRAVPGPTQRDYASKLTRGSFLSQGLRHGALDAFAGDSDADGDWQCDKRQIPSWKDHHRCITSQNLAANRAG